MPKLDEYWPQVFQGPSKPDCPGGARTAHPVPGQQIEEKTHRAKHRRRQNDFVETMPDKNGIDVNKTQCLAKANQRSQPPDTGFEPGDTDLETFNIVTDLIHLAGEIIHLEPGRG